MPLFGKKDKGRLPGDSESANGTVTEPDDKVRQLQEENRAQQMAKQLSFNCQLAHGSPTSKINNFSNVKELYSRIADALNISINEILYCTLNSPKVDMTKLLGGQIGLEDLIFAHCKGTTKIVAVIKQEESLGLTITDNGNGCAFIKRIRDDSVSSKYSELKVGDHVTQINDKTVVGMRHFEVAKMLRELPVGEEFSLNLTEPLRGGFEAIAPRQSKGGGSKNDDLGTGRATLRLRSKGPAVVEEIPSWENKVIIKIDELLESFIGIRDPELANTLLDLGKNLDNPSDYAIAVDNQLGDFGFPDDFIFDIWGAINDAKAGRL